MQQAQEIDDAARLDAAGDHEGAIQLLISAAGRGHAEAFAQLGRRHFLGDRAAHAPAEGLQLLHKAAQQGSAQAAHFLATVHAVGFQAAQNWEAALHNLVLAARLGWEDARSQLRLLAGDGALTTASGQDDEWLDLARRIDLKAWLSPQPVTPLRADPEIARVSGLLRPELCQWFISKARDKLGPALVYDSVQQETIRHATRNNRYAVFGIEHTNVAFTLLQNRIAATLGAPFHNLEPVNLLHYRGTEEIRNHYDFIDPKSPGYAEQIRRNGDRVATFLVYLNDDYEAGETDFPTLGLRHKGRCGDGLYFINVTQDGAPNLATLHAGRPPENGEKWIITQFIRNRRFL